MIFTIRSMKIKKKFILSLMLLHSVNFFNQNFLFSQTSIHQTNMNIIVAIIFQCYRVTNDVHPNAVCLLMLFKSQCIHFSKVRSKISSWLYGRLKILKIIISWNDESKLALQRWYNKEKGLWLTMIVKRFLYETCVIATLGTVWLYWFDSFFLSLWWW